MQPFRKFTNAASSPGVTGLLTADGGTAIDDNKLVRGDGSTGIQGSGITVSDADEISDVAKLTVDSFNFDGNNLTVTGNMNILPSGDVSVGTGNLRTEAGWMISPLAFKVKDANQTVSSSTTLTDDEDLSVTLTAGRTYKFEAILYFTESNTSGIKFGLGGTATHTDIIGDGMHIVHSDISTITYTRFTASGLIYGVTSSLNSTSSVRIHGTTTVNAGGTFIVQYAQNTSHTDPLTCHRGSTLEVWDVEPALGEA